MAKRLAAFGILCCLIAVLPAPVTALANDFTISGRVADAQGKPIAAICHAAQLLAAAGVLEGRKCSAYPASSIDVALAKGTWVDLPMDQAYTDGNLVTGPAWPALHAWLSQFLKILGTRIEA